MEHEADGERHLWFYSIEEAMKEIPGKIAKENLLPWTVSVKQERGGSHWLGGARSYDDFIDKMQNGWPMYLADLQAAMAALKAEVDLQDVSSVLLEKRRRKRARKDYGDTLDMHRVWGGDLEHAWERPVSRHVLIASQRYATIYADLCAASHRDARHGIWRSAAACLLTDVFTSMGFSTEVWVGNSNARLFRYEGPTLVWNAVRIKEFTQPLNEDRVATCMSMAYHRTMGFSLMAAHPYRICSNFGYPINRGIPWPLRQREEAGERVIRIGEAWNKAQAMLEMKRVLDTLKGETRAA